MAGFNSFTQQVCIDAAVTSSKDINSAMAPAEQDRNKPIAQEVVYKTSIVDKVTDVTNEMNVSFSSLFLNLTPDMKLI